MEEKEGGRGGGRRNEARGAYRKEGGLGKESVGEGELSRKQEKIQEVCSEREET